MSKITPIFKSCEDNDANNYRPISLLSNFNRIFEKIMYNRMKDYIDKHNLLYSSQYGFRKGHSTQHAILDIVNAIEIIYCMLMTYINARIDLSFISSQMILISFMPIKT